jgi:hypothetical protein
MDIVFVIVFLVAILAAPAFGVDSRVHDARGWWPGARRPR